MKKFLLLLTLMIATGAITTIKSQCTISDLKVNLTNINTATCELIFDLTWTQEINGGNKFAYLHIWTESAYHTPAANWINMYNGTSNYPVAADLVNALSTIVIDNNSSETPSIGKIYHPDENYILPQLENLTVTKVFLNASQERMTVQNIKISIPVCSGSQTLVFDAWASQSANGKNVHCVTQGGTLVVNEIKPIGNVSCSVPRQFQVFIQNNGPQLGNVWYDVHLDYPPIGILSQNDTAVFTSGLISLPANGYYVSPITDYLPYSNRSPSSGMPLIVEVTVPQRPNTTTAKIENGCGTLPVVITSFTVQRIKYDVVLKWQTANEQQCSGYEIQRMKSGESSFQPIGFAPSKAENGNSDILLYYDYTDRLPQMEFNGIYYYRLKQRDFDGKSTFSEVQFVKFTTSGTYVEVYPNPGNGMTGIFFNEPGTKSDVSLFTVNGVLIKRWAGVTTDHLLIENLSPGVYLIRVVNSLTNESIIKKLLIY